MKSVFENVHSGTLVLSVAVFSPWSRYIPALDNLFVNSCDFPLNFVWWKGKGGSILFANHNLYGSLLLWMPSHINNNSFVLLFTNDHLMLRYNWQVGLIASYFNIFMKPATYERWACSFHNHWWWFCKEDVEEFLRIRGTILDCRTSSANQRLSYSIREFVCPW